MQTALELAEMIKKINVTEKDGVERIPNTEIHMKEWCSHFAMEEKAIRKILEDLKNAHYIFTINTVLPDPHLYLPGTDSFIYAEFSLVNDLKRYSELRLEKTYESTFYKKKSPFQIIKELFPKVREYNNTPIGKAINETVMIEEFTRVLGNAAFEYTDAWKKAKLREIYSEEEETGEEIPDMEIELEKQNRAVDQLPGLTGSQQTDTNSNWGKITNNFPVDFLLRIHFRKLEFDVVRKLITTGKIREEKDLKYVRDTLQKMEERANRDPILKRYNNEMVDLRRLAQGRLNSLRKVSS